MSWQVVVTEFHPISSKDGLDYHPVDTRIDVTDYRRAMQKVIAVIEEREWLTVEPWDRPDGWVLREPNGRVTFRVKIVRVREEDR